MSAPILSFRPDAKAGLVVNLDVLLTTRLLIQANSGGGKSHLIRQLCEETFGRIPQIILDPEGEFSTLRERFPYLLAGGPDADIPADPKTAKVLCKRISELGASVIIDLYHLDIKKRREFVKNFLEALLNLPKAQWRSTLVVLDESHVFAPQAGKDIASKDAVITLCTQGRKRGLLAVLATQRISKLDKDAAADLKNKFIGGTSLDVDVQRAADDLGFDKERRLTLPQLQPGEFYAFGPALSRQVTLVRGGKVQTTHPEPGKIASDAPAPAPAAVRKLIDQMQDLQKRADTEAKTEADLRDQLARAQADLRKVQRGTSAGLPDPAVVQKQIDAALSKQLRELGQKEAVAIRERETLERQLRGQISDLTKRLARIAEIAGQSVPEIAAAKSTATTRAVAPATPAPRREPPPRPASAPRTASAPQSTGVTPVQQRLLNAIATMESVGVEQPVREVVGALAGYSNTSGGSFSNNIGALRTLGLVDYPVAGVISLTDDGRGAAQYPDVPLSTADLHAKWISIVTPVQGRLLQALLDVYPESLTREDLGEQCGYSNTSGGSFSNNIGRLRTMGAVEYPSKGTVVAADILFPEGMS